MKLMNNHRTRRFAAGSAILTVLLWVVLLSADARAGAGTMKVDQCPSGAAGQELVSWSWNPGVREDSSRPGTPAGTAPVSSATIVVTRLTDGVTPCLLQSLSGVTEIVDGDLRLRLRNPALVSYEVHGLYVNNAAKRVQEETFVFSFEDEFFITSRGSYCWSYKSARLCDAF